MKAETDVKLISLVVLIISLMMLIVGIQVVMTEKKEFTEILTLKAQSLAVLVAKIIPSSLSKADQSTLDNDVRNLPKDGDILYVIIENKGGAPVSWYLDRENAFLSGFTDEMEEASQLIKKLQTKTDLIEVQAPVLSQVEPLGTVKIGLTKRWANQRTNQQIIGILVTGLIGIILTIGALVYYPSNRKRVLPPEEIPASALALGNRTKSLDIAEDEIGLLVNSLNKMVHDLKNVITRIGTAVSNVAATSDQLTSTSKKLSKGATEQMEAIEVTSSSFSQMNSFLAGSNELVTGLYKLSNETSSSVLEMTSSTKEMSNQIAVLMEAINTTSSSIEEMSVTVNGIAESISILLISAEDTSASLNEINATVKNVEVSAKEATRLSKTVTSDASNLGMQAVNKTIAGMNKIREDVITSSEIINDLGKKSEEIGKILTVIEEVTRQTNLLALNSAILAAQAGEEGKGFGVVSEEIKSMADRTAVSTKEIAEIVGSIQEGIANAVESMKKGKATVEDGVEVSQEAFVALKTIGESSDQSFKMISEIERAMKEQALGIKQVDEATARITDTLKQIKNSTQEHKKGTILIVSAVQRMQSTADQVNRAIFEQTKGAQQINNAVATVQMKTEEVLKAAVEQKTAGDRIVSSVLKIRAITGQNTTLSSEVNSAVECLVAEAELLKNEVSRFKVSAESEP